MKKLIVLTIIFTSFNVYAEQPTPKGQWYRGQGYQNVHNFERVSYSETSDKGFIYEIVNGRDEQLFIVDCNYELNECIKNSDGVSITIDLPEAQFIKTRIEQSTWEAISTND